MLSPLHMGSDEGFESAPLAIEFRVWGLRLSATLHVSKI